MINYFEKCKITISDYKRVVDRRFRGAYGMRTIERWEVERYGCKSAEVEMSNEENQLPVQNIAHEFRLIDWSYYWLRLLLIAMK